MENKNLDKFKAKFLEEASDHINDLEDALLELEKNKEEKSLIERVFRAMHSLKGGGAMFGFDKVSEVTHHLETIYDYIRIGEVKLSEQILNITFETVDYIKVILEPDIEETKELQQEHKRILEKINLAILNLSNKQQHIDDITSDNKEIKSLDVKSFYIFFKPKPTIFDNGTNPLFLLDELAGLGNYFAIPRFSNIPQLEEIIPTQSYGYWEIFLSTEKDESIIHDVFMFVEDECELEIIELCRFDLFSHEDFIRKINEFNASGHDIKLNELRAFVASIEASFAKDIDNEEDSDSLSSSSNGFQRKSRENKISSIRVASEKLDQLMNLVSELVTTQARLNLYTEANLIPELLLISENVQKLTRQLRDIAFNIVLIPVENMFTRFQRLVRDLSKDLNKNVEFTTKGGETELDKNIIESLSDPIMHILRNSIDHGLEDEAERIKKGKPAKGKISLRAYYSGANVHIEIADDGKGFDTSKILKKAIEKGFVTADISLSQRELIELTFLPGFSTSHKVTDISGRGVGMDVVRKKIADLRGEVDVQTEVNKGTVFTIKLPITLSIIDGLLVKVGETFYIVPLNAVNKIYAVEHLLVTNTFNKLVILDGEQIPYFNLREEFSFGENQATIEEVVVVGFEDKKVALVVDTVIGEYQAVLKSLGEHYKKQDMISGATILGDGTVALVLDTNKMINQFAQTQQLSKVSK